MRLLLVSIFTLTLLFLSSCDKSHCYYGKGDGIMAELAKMGHIVNVNSSNYERVETESLQRLDEHSPYSDGVIEYRENGDLIASIDFGAGEIDKAQYTGKGGDKEVDLKWDDKDKKEDYYKKVVTEPLVKADDCEYIVAGIIKFYEIKSGQWAATFDYGDGTCDEFINKKTDKGESTFSMNDYPEWN